ncbi:unnamed protein product [Cyclocybe aegerita]|uniref:Uncharacterized protein n=1 Tax=Cyclocybe aegerita TaxID=1973307 RepID=A0A8S0X5K8_CYCAE|nr:unnamed protein product [Cyclocybe aegerita]
MLADNVKMQAEAPDWQQHIISLDDAIPSWQRVSTRDLLPHLPHSDRCKPHGGALLKRRAERESELPRVSFKIPTCPHRMLGHLLHQIEPLHSVRVESAKELHERAFTKTSKCRSQRHLSHQTELLHNVRGGSGNELLNTETNKLPFTHV